MDSTDRTFSPPYNVPWATVLNTIEKVANDLPNKIDRSYLGSASGSMKSYLIGAFKGFRLIRDDHTVTDELKEMATNAEARPKLVADLLREFYPAAVTLGATNATPGELDSAFAEMFPTVTGESRVKAIRFFLSAMDYAGLQKSPLWKSPKAGTAARRGRPPRKAVAGQPPAPDQPAPRTGVSLREFVLPSGTTMTISLDRDVIALERVERQFVMGIVDQIEEHVEQHPLPETPRAKKPKAEADDGPAASPAVGGEQAGS